MSPAIGSLVCEACGATLVSGECPRCRDRVDATMGSAYAGAFFAYAIVAAGVWAIDHHLGPVEILAPLTATIAMLQIPALALLGRGLKRLVGARRVARRRHRAQPRPIEPRRETVLEGPVTLEPGSFPRLRIVSGSTVAVVDPRRALVRGELDPDAIRAGRLRARVVGVPRPSADRDPDGGGYRDAHEVVELDGEGTDAPLVELRTT